MPADPSFGNPRDMASLCGILSDFMRSLAPLAEPLNLLVTGSDRLLLSSPFGASRTPRKPCPGCCLVTSGVVPLAVAYMCQ